MQRTSEQNTITCLTIQGLVTIWTKDGKMSSANMYKWSSPHIFLKTEERSNLGFF